ncbi:MAG: DUF1579 domain-containing protein [Planctomycetota bacterium]
MIRIAFALLLLACPLLAQEPDPDMAALIELGTPGPEHEHLTAMAGNWDVEGEFFVGPGQPMLQSKGQATFEVLLGGRYVRQVFTGDFMGERFEGIGIEAYDKIKGKYVSTWIDSMSTWVLTMEGDLDPTTGALNYTGTSPAPERGPGQTKQVRSTTHYDRKAGVMKVSMSEVGPDGAEVVLMRLVYTKQQD